MFETGPVDLELVGGFVAPPPRSEYIEILYGWNKHRPAKAVEHFVANAMGTLRLLSSRERSEMQWSRVETSDAYLEPSFWEPTGFEPEFSPVSWEHFPDQAEIARDARDGWRYRVGVFPPVEGDASGG